MWCWLEQHEALEVVGGGGNLHRLELPETSVCQAWDWHGTAIGRWGWLEETKSGTAKDLQCTMQPLQPNLLLLFYSYLPYCPLSCSKCLLAVFSNFLALTISLTRSEEGARERGRGMEREELFPVFCVYFHKVLGGRNLVYAMGELCELQPPGCWYAKGETNKKIYKLPAQAGWYSYSSC